VLAIIVSIVPFGDSFKTFEEYMMLFFNFSCSASGKWGGMSVHAEI
jgi:hypothetical protein